MLNVELDRGLNLFHSIFLIKQTGLRFQERRIFDRDESLRCKDVCSQQKVQQLLSWHRKSSACIAV